MAHNPALVAGHVKREREKRWAAAAISYLANNDACCSETAIARNQIPNNERSAVRRLVRGGRIVEINGKWFLNQRKSKSLLGITMLGLGRGIGKAYIKAKRAGQGK